MGWDDEAAGWDDSPPVRAYNEAAFSSLQDLLAARDVPLAGARVLDFGCGTGLLTEQLVRHGATVVALDLSPQMVERLIAKGLPRVTAVAGSLEDHVLGPFSLVTCSSVCAFVDDYPGTVHALVSMLDPGGYFVQWDWELDPDAEEAYGLSRDGIARALTGAGLQDVEVRVGFEVAFGEMTMAPLMGAGRR